MAPHQSPNQKSVTFVIVQLILSALTAKSPFFLHRDTCFDLENYGVANWVKTADTTLKHEALRG